MNNKYIKIYKWSKLQLSAAYFRLDNANPYKK